MSIVSQARAHFATGGSEAVCEFARSLNKLERIVWAECPVCATKTPTHDGACLVCETPYMLAAPVNPRTWAIVTDNWSDGLPPLAEFTTPVTGRYCTHRFLLVSWYVTESTYAGAFQTLEAVKDFDWDYGVPMFFVDLTQPAQRAMIPLDCVIEIADERDDLSEHYFCSDDE